MGRSALSWHGALGAYPTCAQQEAKEVSAAQADTQKLSCTHKN